MLGCCCRGSALGKIPRSRAQTNLRPQSSGTGLPGSRRKTKTQLGPTEYKSLTSLSALAMRTRRDVISSILPKAVLYKPSYLNIQEGKIATKHVVIPGQ